MKKISVNFYFIEFAFCTGEFLNGKNQEVQDLAEQRRQSFMAEKRLVTLYVPAMKWRNACKQI